MQNRQEKITHHAQVALDFLFGDSGELPMDTIDALNPHLNPGLGRAIIEATRGDERVSAGLKEPDQFHRWRFLSLAATRHAAEVSYLDDLDPVNEILRRHNIAPPNEMSAG